MSAGSFAFGTVPVAPRDPSSIILRGRVPIMHKIVATTDTTAVAVTIAPGRWAEFFADAGSSFSGYEFSYDGTYYFPVEPGDLYPSPVDMPLQVRARTGAVGNCNVRSFDYETGLARCMSRGRIQTVSISGSGAATTPRTLGPATRQALTTATPGTYTSTNTPVFMLVKAKATNAAAAYVARNSTEVNVSTTRFELVQSDFVTVYGTSFGFLGTTGDHLDILEYL